MKMKRLLPLLLLSALICTGAAAQQADAALQPASRLEILPGEPAAPAESGKVSFLMQVQDQNGEPVPEVCVSFCSDTACLPAWSDEAGRIAFSGEAGSYHLLIVEVPDGYRYDEEAEYATGDSSCEMILTITKD